MSDRHYIRKSLQNLKKVITPLKVWGNSAIGQKKQPSDSHLAVTAEIVQLPQDFEENEAAAGLLDTHICYVTTVLIRLHAPQVDYAESSLIRP